MNNDSKIYIAGHTGMVGSALYQRMRSVGFTNIITSTRDKLNLLNKEILFKMAGTPSSLGSFQSKH